MIKHFSLAKFFLILGSSVIGAIFVILAGHLLFKNSSSTEDDDVVMEPVPEEPEIMKLTRENIELREKNALQALEHKRQIIENRLLEQENMVKKREKQQQQNEQKALEELQKHKQRTEEQFEKEKQRAVEQFEKEKQRAVEQFEKEKQNAEEQFKKEKQNAEEQLQKQREQFNDQKRQVESTVVNQHKSLIDEKRKVKFDKDVLDVISQVNSGQSPKLEQEYHTLVQNKNFLSENDAYKLKIYNEVISYFQKMANQNRIEYQPDFS